MRLFLALIGVLLCGFSTAAETAVEKPVQNVIQKKARHHIAELRMDESVCQQLVKHVPDADVAYQPGVDVDGRSVAPADINNSPLNGTLQHQIAIKLYNDTAATFGLKSPQILQPGPPGEQPTTVPLVQGETEIGYVTFKDNHAYLNGKPLDGGQQDRLAVLCIQREKR